MSAQKAVSYFVSVGWTPAQAAGIAANLQAESGFRPDAVGDGGQAYGIAQWHGDRQANFERAFGKPIVGSTLDEQLAFVHWELTNTEKKAGDALRACTTAAEAGACVSKLYERPADREGEAAKRAALATKIAWETPATIPTQPAAPIEDRSIPYQEHPMPSAVDTAASIASVFNPLAGGLIGLVGNIFKAVSPALQGKVAKEINRHTDDPAIGVQIAQDLASMVMSQAKVLTGEADDFKAAAAIVQPAQAANLAKLEASIDAQIDRLSKAGDKASTWDQALWEAQNRGRQTVSTIAIEERRAGIWDMTQWLVVSLLLMLWGIAWGLLGAIVWLATKEQPNAAMLTALIGLAGPIWTGAIVASVAAIVAYRFDGSKESTAQSQAILAAATKGS